MAEESALRRSAFWKLARELDPFRATWRLFTNVRWAIGIITFLILAGLLGVLIPQVPPDLRGDAGAESRWLTAQEGKFGGFTDTMNDLGLFDVFHARWFIFALGLLVVSVSVCTASRLPPIWRVAMRPRKRVTDAYFGGAKHRFDYATPSDRSALEGALRRRRFAVERYEEPGATYLFADRFQLAQLATFVSHLALIVLLAAGLVSRFDGFSGGMMLAEGASAPVFALTDPNQMQVQLLDAVGRFDEAGRPLEYSSQLAIFRDGEEVRRCRSTVNSPCSYDGYRFHQSAYFGFGADLQVRDLASGNVIFRETLSLADTLPSPHVVVRDAAGGTLLDETLVLTDVLSSEDFVYYGRLVTLPDGRQLTVGARAARGGERWQLAVFEPGDGPIRLVLGEGESATADGLTFDFADLNSVPAIFVSDMPLPEGVESGRGEVLVEMSNVVFGTTTTSEGTNVEAPAGSGPPELTLIGLAPQAATLRPGESAEIGGLEYTFVGQREFAGISVKKDRGSMLIWIGAGLLIAGLVVTFWVPRRRLWAKITPERTYLAGQAGHLVDLPKEMMDLARAGGAEIEEPGGPDEDD